MDGTLNPIDVFFGDGEGNDHLGHHDQFGRNWSMGEGEVMAIASVSIT